MSEKLVRPQTKAKRGPTRPRVVFKDITNLEHPPTALPKKRKRTTEPFADRSQTSSDKRPTHDGQAVETRFLQQSTLPPQVPGFAPILPRLESEPPQYQHPTYSKIPVAIRAALITLNHFNHWTLEKLESVFGIRRSTVHKIIQKAKERAGLHQNIHALLEHIDDEERSGRPEKVTEGSAESMRIRHLLLSENNRYDSFEKVHAREDIPYGISTIYKIAKDHRCPCHPAAIVRKVAPNKPQLTTENKLQRYRFACRALEDLRGGKTIIFTDETYIEGGGGPRGKSKVSVLSGTPAEELANSRKKSPMNFMFWGAMCLNDNVNRPSFLWIPSSQAEKVSELPTIEESLRAMNDLAKLRSEVNVREANKTGTWQNDNLRKKNDAIEETNQELIQWQTEMQLSMSRDNRILNRQDTRRVKRAPRPLETAESMYGYEEIKRGSRDKGGIDWYLYRKTILEQFIIPYAQAVAENSGIPRDQVLVVEDNAPIHVKAHKTMIADGTLYDDEGRPKYYKYYDWPPNSPDLNPIELAWGVLKDKVAELFVPQGNTKEERERLERFLRDLWTSDEMSDFMKKVILRWKDRLQECINHRGGNNFRG